MRQEGPRRVLGFPGEAAGQGASERTFASLGTRQATAAATQLPHLLVETPPRAISLAGNPQSTLSPLTWEHPAYPDAEPGPVWKRTAEPDDKAKGTTSLMPVPTKRTALELSAQTAAAPADRRRSDADRRAAAATPGGERT